MIKKKFKIAGEQRITASHLRGAKRFHPKDALTRADIDQEPLTDVLLIPS